MKTLTLDCTITPRLNFKTNLLQMQIKNFTLPFWGDVKRFLTFITENLGLGTNFPSHIKKNFLGKVLQLW